MKRDLFFGLERRSTVARRPGPLLTACILALSTFLSIMTITPPAQAQSVIRISNDPGGNLSARVRQINAIRSTGQKVEIRNGYCNSACTMYLGLANTCVTPNAKFGFHGPQSASSGLALLPNQFEQWSQVMARHYPPQLRGWFMNNARYSKKLITVRGNQLIKMGVRRCA